MVSILIVSHSIHIARGVREFASQVASPELQIIDAGGNIDGGLGTNVESIYTALEQIASPDGTLVLVALGSAVISVEMAIEMLGTAKVIISDAPLVEGAYLAALEASADASLEEVAAAALQAREMIKVHK